MPPLISAQSVTKSYGARPLFSGISLSVGEGEHIGLIGANGSGKSTLLRLLAGMDTPDTGEVARRRGLRYGFVAQEDVFEAGATVDDVLRASALPRSGGDEIALETAVQTMLGRVGFADSDLSVAGLSGGWKKRLAIASELIKEPEILLLDEPTNHLDLEGILWLENLLSTLPFSYVMISHDRYFLERTVSRIVELGRQYPDGFIGFDGAYSEFLVKREDFLAHQIRREETLTQQVRKEIDWLRRGPPARTTKAKYRIDEAGKMIEDLSDLRERVNKETVARLDFTSSGRKTRDLVVAKGIALHPGDRELVSGLDLTLSPKMRLGLLGPNGSGKTTLLQTLAGEREPAAGTIKRADRLRTVYFTQAREHIPRDMNLRRALAGDLDTVVYNGAPMHVSSWAKRFLFRPEQLDVAVERLSGGEQARVLIARLMLEPADVLILDEPTNDLDIPTLDVLEESLLEFPGALVLVTHDRYILDRVSTELLALDGEGGARFYADYYQWEARQKEVEAEAAAPAPKKAIAVDEPAAKTKTFRGLTRPEQRELDRMEEIISEAEATLAATELAMASPEAVSDYVKLQQLMAECDGYRHKIEALYARWQELEAKLEAG